MKCFKNGSKNISRCIPLLTALFILSGCGGTNFKEFYFGDLFSKGSSSNIDKTADQLAVEGMRNMQKKDYEEAAQNFKKLREHYPYSKFAILADLKLGDAYFQDKKYGAAAIAYEEFVRLHPRNEVVPYVLYQVGMSHFLSFSTVDRDPEETAIAMQAFLKVIQNFPNSSYAKRSEKQLLECKKRLASHDLNVARHYYIIKEYAAARNRLNGMIEKYPQAIADLGYGKEVQKMLGKCEVECAKGERGPGIWTKMGL